MRLTLQTCSVFEPRSHSVCKIYIMNCVLQPPLYIRMTLLAVFKNIYLFIYLHRSTVDEISYEVNYELYRKILPNSCRVSINRSEVWVKLKKEEPGNWPRLLKQKTKVCNQLKHVNQLNGYKMITTSATLQPAFITIVIINFFLLIYFNFSQIDCRPQIFILVFKDLHVFTNF